MIKIVQKLTVYYALELVNITPVIWYRLQKNKNRFKTVSQFHVKPDVPFFRVGKIQKRAFDQTALHQRYDNLKNGILEYFFHLQYVIDQSPKCYPLNLIAIMKARSKPTGLNSEPLLK